MLIGAAPLAMGLLTNHGPPVWHPGQAHIKEACTRAAAYCQSKGVDISRLALDFALKNPLVPCTLVSTGDVAEMKRNIEVATDSCTAAELEVAGSWHDAEDKETKVSETKFKQQLRETFRKFDANHNNKLEKEELADMLRAMGRRPLQSKIDSIFETLDEDGDGSIDFAEFLRYFKEHHAPLKRSKSNVTSEDVKAEVEKVVTERKKEKAAEVVSKKRKAVDDGKDEKTHTLAGAAADSLMSGGELDASKFAHSERLFEQQLRKIFSTFDSNNNNVITKGELKTALTKLGKKPKQAKVDAIFETLDTDGDGKIDFDEFSKYFKPSDAEDEEPQPAKKKAKH